MTVEQGLNRSGTPESRLGEPGGGKTGLKKRLAIHASLVVGYLFPEVPREGEMAEFDANQNAGDPLPVVYEDGSTPPGPATMNDTTVITHETHK